VSRTTIEFCVRRTRDLNPDNFARFRSLVVWFKSRRTRSREVRRRVASAHSCLGRFSDFYSVGRRARSATAHSRLGRSVLDDRPDARDTRRVVVCHARVTGPPGVATRRRYRPVSLGSNALIR
jgi:hypothetical protein